MRTRVYIPYINFEETGGGDKEQPAGSRYASTMSAEMEIPICVRGYHVYKDIWAAAVGELLMCSREPRQQRQKVALRRAILWDRVATA